MSYRNHSLIIIAILAFATMSVTVLATEEDQLDAGSYSSVDFLSPVENDLVRYRVPRPSDWCQYILRSYPPQLRLRPSETYGGIRKRGYMGIEIPDFITNQDGTLQGGSSATGSKPRYFKNG